MQCMLHVRQSHANGDFKLWGLSSNTTILVRIRLDSSVTFSNICFRMHFLGCSWLFDCSVSTCTWPARFMGLKASTASATAATVEVYEPSGHHRLVDVSCRRGRIGRRPPPKKTC